MNRSVTFSNSPLTTEKLVKLDNIICSNDSISSIDIYITRRVKENKVKITESHGFNKIKELINYIEVNEIEKINDIRINIYSEKKMYVLEYNNAYLRWEFSFNEQDTNADSLILNLNVIFKNNIFSIYRQYRGVILYIISIIYFAIMYTMYNKIHFLFLGFISFVYLLLILDVIFVRNIAFRENKFIINNKDEIIISIISFIAGLIAPEIFEWVVKIFE